MRERRWWGRWQCRGDILLLIYLTPPDRETERQRDSDSVKQYSNNYIESGTFLLLLFLYPEETEMFHFPNPDELPFLINSASLTDEQKQILSIVFYIFPTTS